MTWQISMPGSLGRGYDDIDLAPPASSPASLGFSPSTGDWQPPTWYWLISAASAGLSAFHGYKRNESVGWAIVWGLLGGAFPIITPAIAFAEGYGEPKR